MSDSNYEVDLEFGLNDKFLAALIGRDLDLDLKIVTKVYIEAAPKGSREGTAIENYVVEERGGRVLRTFTTQAEAITWAKNEGYSPHVARIRHLNDKKIADYWRTI